MTRKAYSRQQKMTIVYGILSITLIVVILQLWLLTATMNAFLGGEESVIIPAAIASTLCFLWNAGMLRYIYLMERQQH
jgi:hypothetical protein